MFYRIIRASSVALLLVGMQCSKRDRGLSGVWTGSLGEIAITLELRESHGRLAGKCTWLETLEFNRLGELWAQTSDMEITA
jgi:hypothetical protein